MSQELTISQLLKQFDEKIAWFNSDDFELEKAKEKFIEVKALADEIEEKLLLVKNEVEVLAKDFK